MDTIKVDDTVRFKIDRGKAVGRVLAIEGERATVRHVWSLRKHQRKLANLEKVR